MTYSLLQNTDARHLTVTRHVSPQTSTLLSSLTMSLEQLTVQNRKLQARRLSFQVQPLTTMAGLSLLPPTLSSSPPSASRVTKREKPPTAHVTRMESKMCLLANDSGSRENVTPIIFVHPFLHASGRGQRTFSQSPFTKLGHMTSCARARVCVCARVPYK